MMKWKTIAFGVLSVSFIASTFVSHDSVAASDRFVAPSAALEQSDVDLPEIIALVRRRGWPSDLGSMCPLSLKVGSDNACLAQQIAFFEGDHNGRAFNVLPLRARSASYIVVLDLTVEGGVAYLASATGELISAATLIPGHESKTIPSHEAQYGFRRELQFWAANVGQFDKWLEKRKYGPVTNPESTN
jgi:hypothetical protein